MIVEDEPLVAMAMSDLMAELGLTVVGPFSRVGQAIAALKENTIDAALLDINLAGELVYPLADILIADNVPFVFVTGYGGESIDRRYANIRVLQKPIKRDMLQSMFARPALVASRAGTEPSGRRRAVAR
jgi:two-component SAPR family response regulator